MAGGDIRYFRTLDRWRAERYVLAVQAMQDALGLLPQPVIAAVNGTALGGGLRARDGLRHPDRRRAADFGQPEVRSASSRELAGRRTCRGSYLPAARSSSSSPASGSAPRRALECGLVDEVVAAGASVARAHELAEAISANAPLAVAAAKRAVNLGLQMGVQDGHRLEASLFATLVETKDFHEGIDAFFEKRPPTFTRE